MNTNTFSHFQPLSPLHADKEMYQTDLQMKREERERGERERGGKERERDEGEREEGEREGGKSYIFPIKQKSCTVYQRMSVLQSLRRYHWISQPQSCQRREPGRVWLRPLLSGWWGREQRGCENRWQLCWT